ncbi:MAG: 3-oxoacyl-ACP reductase family protein [Chloroflexota bacterium]
MSASELSGKVSMVTGSAMGIGRVIALKLASLGSRVAINDLPGGDGGQKTRMEIEELGGEAMLALADIRDGAAVKTAVESVVDRWGRIDILINNAAIGGAGRPVVNTAEEEWDSILNTNLRGAFLCSKYCLPHMIDAGWGRIINIASIAGTRGTPGKVGYSASKGGLIAFTRSLSREAGVYNVTVNAIAPGFIVTEKTQGQLSKIRDTVLARNSLKRLGTPEDVAELTAFLVGVRAGFITGQVICVDGGETA